MSDIEKIHGITPDLTRENVDRLLALFPDVATEITDPKTGRTERAVDFDALKERLSDVAEGNRERYSDDGEPQKTAGLPTLQVLQHAELTDVIVVVTRYFGGTLLGTGGLVRAYTQATQAGIEAAHKVTISQCIDITITLPYSMYDQLNHLLGNYETKVISTEYTDVITIVVRMLLGSEEPLLKALTELMHGKEQVQVSDPFDAPF